MNTYPYYIVLDEAHRPLVHMVDGMRLVAHSLRESAEAMAVRARRERPLGTTGEFTVVEIWFTLDKPAPEPRVVEDWTWWD
jgi:hypothetical protein